MRMNKLIKRIGIVTLNLALAFNGISFQPILQIQSLKHPVQIKHS